MDAAYEQLTDEALIARARGNDSAAEDALYERYKPFVRIKARSYFLIGADQEDIIQEGMIGLYKAIRDFDGQKSSFRSFAEVCIVRQMITAVKAATRQKHIPLNSYISLNRPAGDFDQTLIDVLAASRVSDPEEQYIGREEVEVFAERIQRLLTPLEREALELYMSGCSYAQIADKLHRHAKSIDNALQRVKRKLEKAFVSE